MDQQDSLPTDHDDKRMSEAFANAEGPKLFAGPDGLRIEGQFSDMPNIPAIQPPEDQTDDLSTTGDGDAIDHSRSSNEEPPGEVVFDEDF